MKNGFKSRVYIEEMDPLERKVYYYAFLIMEGHEIDWETGRTIEEEY